MTVKLLILGLALFLTTVKCQFMEDYNSFLNRKDILRMNNEVYKFARMADSNTRYSRLCQTASSEYGLCVQTSRCEAIPDATLLFTLRDKNPCLAEDICCPIIKVRGNPMSMLSPKVLNGCGWSKRRPFQDKVAKGKAELGEFPWMIAVINKSYYTRENGVMIKHEESYVGGGALIHPKVVITAAHKVEDYEPRELKVSSDYDRRNDFVDRQRNVRKIIRHENYFNVHAHYNVALLILQLPFELLDSANSLVGVACLAPQLPPPGTSCYSMGWGQDFLNDDNYSEILKKVEVPLVERSTCERNYKNSKLGSRFSLHRTLTCAGGEEGIDTCKGDGGSPLVCPIQGENQRYEIVGLVAYSLGCGTKLPAVYVNIPELYDWIGGEFTLEGLNKTEFEYSP